MIALFAILMFIIIVASVWWFGLWSNLILLINFFLAALVASSFYENLAGLIESNAPNYHLMSDFIAIWALFVLTFIILRALTDTLSSMRAKFEPVTEMIGRSVLSVWVAGAFVCFALFTLHLAPLPPDAFQSAAADHTLGVGPDRQWMAFIQSRSRGALCEAADSNMLPEYQFGEHPDDKGKNLRIFDPFSEFIIFNLDRRTRISRNKVLQSNPK